jgi:hypothetical protein
MKMSHEPTKTLTYEVSLISPNTGTFPNQGTIRAFAYAQDKKNQTIGGLDFIEIAEKGIPTEVKWRAYQRNVGNYGENDGFYGIFAPQTLAIPEVSQKYFRNILDHIAGIQYIIKKISRKRKIELTREMKVMTAILLLLESWAPAAFSLGLLKDYTSVMFSSENFQVFCIQGAFWDSVQSRGPLNTEITIEVERLRQEKK